MDTIKCDYCGNWAEMTDNGLCVECVSNHESGACEGRVGSCEACLVVSVAALMGGE